MEKKLPKTNKVKPKMVGLHGFEPESIEPKSTSPDHKQ
jgi:hypothetical protein